MPLQAWGFSSRKRRPDLLVHSHSHPWPPSLEGLVSHWAVPCATSKWRTWMSPYAHTSLFICLCCEMTNVLTPALRTLARPPSCGGGVFLRSAPISKHKEVHLKRRKQWLWWRCVPPNQLPSTTDLSVPEKQLERTGITGSGLSCLTPNCPAGLWGRRSLEDQVNDRLI